MSEIKGIAVCGLGKLGSPIAAVFAASSVPVIGFDIDPKKVEALASFAPPVCETELLEYLELDEVRRHLRATVNIEEAVQLSDACLFVTPTPSISDGSFDHSYLLSAITVVAKEVAKKKRRKYLFVICSTVMPSFLTNQVAPLLRRYLNGYGYGYGLVYKPEFIALGTVIRDLHYPDILLIGEESEEDGEKVEKLYRQMVLHDCQARRMPLTDAELAKISLNCFVTMKISFANQIGQVSRRLGADAKKVLGAIGFDRRIGHAALLPGLPFGGPCFPRDNRMFKRVAEQVGERALLAEATDLVNLRSLRCLLTEVPDHGDVGILGLAYKPGASISDDSAGDWWAHALRSRGRRVKTHDPLVPHTSELKDVLACPTIIVGCPWPQYKSLTLAVGTKILDPSGEIKITWVQKGEAVCETYKEVMA